jgi:hypothetical protein
MEENTIPKVTAQATGFALGCGAVRSRGRICALPGGASQRRLRSTRLSRGNGDRNTGDALRSAMNLRIPRRSISWEELEPSEPC